MHGQSEYVQKHGDKKNENGSNIVKISNAHYQAHTLWLPSVSGEVNEIFQAAGGDYLSGEMLPVKLGGRPMRASDSAWGSQKRCRIRTKGVS